MLLATYYAGIIDRYLQTQIEDLVQFPHYTIHCSKAATGHSSLLVLSKYPQNESVFGKYRGKMNTDSHPQLHHCSGFMKTLGQVMETEFLWVHETKGACCKGYTESIIFILIQRVANQD